MFAKLEQSCYSFVLKDLNNFYDIVNHFIYQFIQIFDRLQNFLTFTFDFWYDKASYRQILESKYI